MKSPTVLSEFALRDCLRAAEADANRFHGGATPWTGRQAGAGRLLLIAAVTVLAIGAATWLVQSVSPTPTPQVALLEHRAAPAAPAVLAAPQTSPTADVHVVPSKPVAEVVIDGGDIDVAARMPASVLSSHLKVDGPPVAPMNVPTVPDPFDRTPAAEEPAGEPRADGDGAG